MNDSTLTRSRASAMTLPAKALLKPHHLRTLLLLSFSTTTSSTATRVSLYLSRARAIDNLRLRLRLRRHYLSLSPLPLPSNLDPFVASQALRSAPSPDTALSLFRSLQSHPTFSLSHHTINALAKTFAVSRRVADLRSLLDDIDGGCYPNILPPSPMDRLRWFAAAGELGSSLRMWDVIRSSAAGSVRRHPCTESYNIVMGLYVAQCLDFDAVKTFSKMVEEGENPNSRTYTVIIEHLVKAGKLETALQVFDRLPLMRVRRTSKQYSVLAYQLSSIGQFDEVGRLIDEMKCDAILPGRAVRAAMVKMREAGYVKGTEEFERELSPDSRIGYVGGSNGNSSDEDEDADAEENGSVASGDSDRVQLKPWLDPNALASALSEWDAREVEALEEAKFVWTTRLVCKLLRGFKKAETAWKFFTWVSYQSEGFTHDCYTVSRMIAILARNGHEGLVDRLISKVKTEGILLPFSTVRLVMDFFGISKKPEAALKIFRDIRSICAPLSNSNHALLCSSLLRTLTKCRRGIEAMDILEEMISGGVRPDVQTFSGLMQFFAMEGDLRSIQKLFGMVRQCGNEPDAYMYQVLIRAYIKHDRTALALRMFEDMRNSNLVPDLATKSLLVKSLWDEGKRREVAYVEERSEEVREGLPAALPGHVWTVSSKDLMWVHDIYRNSFADDCK